MHCTPVAQRCALMAHFELIGRRSKLTGRAPVLIMRVLLPPAAACSTYPSRVSSVAWPLPPLREMGDYESRLARRSGGRRRGGRLYSPSAPRPATRPAPRRAPGPAPRAGGPRGKSPPRAAPCRPAGYLPPRGERGGGVVDRGTDGGVPAQ